VAVKVTLTPWPTVVEGGEIDVVVLVRNSEAFQAMARLLASTEPRPVTTLYPVGGSKFEASYPKNPVEGHCSAVGQGATGSPTWQ
jgi:hypothetical protein